MRSAIVSFAATILLAGCDSATDSGRAGPPARLDIVSGDAQQAVAGEELPQPLVVKVLDAKGKPVKGQIVNFRVVSGGGSVFAGSAATNDDGVAQERWTLGKVAADSQRVEARAVDASTGNALVFGTFRATATAGAAAGVQPVGAASFTAPLGSDVDSLAVRVADANGNPVPNAPVSWVVTAGGGTVSPAASVTGADGVAKTRWSLAPSADSARAEARLGTQTAAFTAIPVADTTRLSVTVIGDSLSGPARSVVTQPAGVRVVLKDGRPVRGIGVYWNGSGITRTTDAQGYAYFPLTFPPTGTVTYSLLLYDLVHADPAHTWGTAVITLTATGAAPAIVLVPNNTFWLSRGTVTSGTVFMPTLFLNDADRNGAPNVAVQWQVTAGDGTVSPAVTVSNASGVVRATYTAGSAAYQEIRATIPGVGTRLFYLGTTPHTYTTRILPASPDTLVAHVGDEIHPRVEIRDETGQLFPNTPSLAYRWGNSASSGVIGDGSGFGDTGLFVAIAPGTVDLFVGPYYFRCAEGYPPCLPEVANLGARKTVEVRP